MNCFVSNKMMNGVKGVFRCVAYALFSLFIISSNCKRMHVVNENKTPWKGTISAPIDAPVEIITGELIAPDYTYYFDPIWGTVHPGWGESSGNLGESEEPHLAPSKLKLLWYSHKEQSFYEGIWDLKSSELNQKFGVPYQYWDARRNLILEAKHKMFVIGLGPGGLVNLWFGGENDQYLVGTYHASRKEVRKEELRENAHYIFNKDFLDVVKTNISNDELVNNYVALNGESGRATLEAFNQKINWKIEVIEDGHTLKSYKIERLKLVNGEEFGDLSNPIVQVKDAKAAAPYFLLLNYESQDGTDAIIRLELIPSEVNQYLLELAQSNQTIEIKINVESNAGAMPNIQFVCGQEVRNPKPVVSRLTKLVN